MPNIPTVNAVKAFTPIKNPNNCDIKLNATMQIPPKAEFTISLNIAPIGFENKTIIKQHNIMPIVQIKTELFIKTPPYIKICGGCTIYDWCFPFPKKLRLFLTGLER